MSQRRTDRLHFPAFHSPLSVIFVEIRYTLLATNIHLYTPNLLGHPVSRHGTLKAAPPCRDEDAFVGHSALAVSEQPPAPLGSPPDTTSCVYDQRTSA
jgi:hypothetical protein